MNYRTILFVVAISLLPTAVLAYAEGAYYGQGTYYGQGSYYGQGYYQSSYEATYKVTITASTSIANASKGLTVSGGVTATTKHFVIDDPLDPANELLYHSNVESPDVKNIYDGTTTLDADGEAVVQLPAYFEALNYNFRYQLSAIGQSMPDLFIKTEVTDNQFTIGGGVPGGEVSWQVTGIRHDPYILANPIIPVVEKTPYTIVNKGQYLDPQAYVKPTLFQQIGSAWQWLTSKLGSL